ncbi:hypothetical protein OAI93_03615, partial [bacterium]|nr:hypothetical protein [bacterium]
DGESAPYEPDGTFLVGKVTPKGKKFIFEDMMCPITSKELYPFYIKLPQDEFIPRFNKTICNFIQEQLKEARDCGVPYEQNIWFKPNIEFVNWFQEKGLDIKNTKSLLDNDITEKEDWNGAFWSLADELRNRKEDGEFESYDEAYQFGADHYTKDGHPFEANQLKRNYHKAKSEGRVD